MADSAMKEPTENSVWVPDITVVTRAKHTLHEFQLLAAKTVLPELGWDTIDNVEEPVNYVMSSLVDLKPLFEGVTNRMIIDDIYESVEKVPFSKIICQLVMAEKAFPGFDHDLLNCLMRNKSTTFSDAKKQLEDVVSFRDPKKGGAILIQLASMLQLPSVYSHPLDDMLTDVDDNSTKMCYFIPHTKNAVDFTYATNNLLMGDISSNPKKSVDFQPVEEPDFKTLNKHPLKCATTASPSTLCLFGNMGPTKTSIDKLDVVDPIAMKYFSQPSFNLRSTVVFERSLKMLQTCAGKDEKKCNLVTHGVCLVPYLVEYTSATTGEFGSKVTTWNTVKPCYDSKSQLGHNLCGNPIAKPLGLDSSDDGISDFENLFQILLGISIPDGIEFSPPYSEFIQKEKSEDWKRLNDLLVSKVLLESVDKYYQGFRSIASWQRLHCRLRGCFLPYASGAFKKPTTVHNLIYQCMVMIQASSKFRLSYLGGLGRHFGVIHSLLGVDPSATNFPLELEVDVNVVPPFQFHMVGTTNRNVDLVDVGGMETEITKQQYTLYQSLSGEIQSKDEAIVKTDITNFLIRWCEFCSEPETKLLDKILPLELRTPLSDRGVVRYYLASKFQEFEQVVPLMAIDFIAKELVTGNADVECLRKLINLEIKKKNKAAKGKTVTGDSTWEDKAEWFRNQMSKKYESGYLTRNTNLFSDNMHIVFFIMSHGFQWYPKRNPVGPLLQFLQDTKTHRISSEGMWFPNPNLTKWVATSPALLSDQSLKEPMFILPSNIKKLSALGDNTGQFYIRRLRWFVVNPIKALTAIFIKGIVKGGSSTASPENQVKYLLMGRHHPAVFDEVLGLFQEYGQILPISNDMMEQMPTVCDLLRLNTFSKVVMESYCNISKIEADALFYDPDDEEQQFSNVGMAVAIVICLLCGNIAEKPKTEDWQDIVRLNLSTYPGLFSKGKRNFGIIHELPEEGSEIVPEWLERYKRYLQIPFSHPSDIICEVFCCYSLADVIDGLFYADVLPPDFIFPETVADGGPIPKYRVTLAQRQSIEKFLKKNFDVVKHYYGYFQDKTILDSVKIYVQPTKPPPNKGVGDEFGPQEPPKTNPKRKTTKPSDELLLQREAQKKAAQAQVQAQKQAQKLAELQKKAVIAKKKAELAKKKAELANKAETSAKNRGEESESDKSGSEPSDSEPSDSEETATETSIKSKISVRQRKAQQRADLRKQREELAKKSQQVNKVPPGKAPRFPLHGNEPRGKVLPPQEPDTFTEHESARRKRKRGDDDHDQSPTGSQSGFAKSDAERQSEDEEDDQGCCDDSEEVEESRVERFVKQNSATMLAHSYNSLSSLIDDFVIGMQPLLRLRAAYQRAEKELGFPHDADKDEPILTNPDHIRAWQSSFNLEKDRTTENFAVSKNYVFLLKRAAVKICGAQEPSTDTDFEARVMAYFKGSNNYPTAYAHQLRGIFDAITFPKYPAVPGDGAAGTTPVQLKSPAGMKRKVTRVKYAIKLGGWVRENTARSAAYQNARALEGIEEEQPERYTQSPSQESKDDDTVDGNNFGSFSPEYPSLHFDSDYCDSDDDDVLDIDCNEGVPITPVQGQNIADDQPGTGESEEGGTRTNANDGLLQESQLDDNEDRKLESPTSESIVGFDDLFDAVIKDLDVSRLAALDNNEGGMGHDISDVQQGSGASEDVGKPDTKDDNEDRKPSAVESPDFDKDITIQELLARASAGPEPDRLSPSVDTTEGGSSGGIPLTQVSTTTISSHATIAIAVLGTAAGEDKDGKPPGGPRAEDTSAKTSDTSLKALAEIAASLEEEEVEKTPPTEGSTGTVAAGDPRAAAGVQDGTPGTHVLEDGATGTVAAGDPRAAAGVQEGTPGTQVSEEVAPDPDPKKKSKKKDHKRKSIKDSYEPEVREKRKSSRSKNNK